MDYLLFMVIIGTSIWVYFDAKSIGAKKGQINGGKIMRKVLTILFVFVLITVIVAAENNLYAAQKQRNELSTGPKQQKQCEKYNFKIGDEYNIPGEYSGPANSDVFPELKGTESVYFKDPEGCSLTFYVKNFPSAQYQIKTSDKLEVKVKLTEEEISSNRSVGQYIGGYVCEYISLGEEILKQKEAEKQKQNQEVAEKQNKINTLVQKWSSSGPPKDFLGGQFQTYAGSGLSGNMAAVVELLDKLNGKVKWTKKENLWLLEQSVSDNVTRKKHKFQWAFYDLRKDKGYIWLERVVINGKDFPSAQLAGIVIKVMQ
ncbi:MAG: hypothetical protein KA807_15860 [Prolixibacteraceae bacterium]|nr:hypothetical protein [Prolixibacteraceae bacterium]